MAEWIQSHIIEIFGALTGILYVFLEIRQNILLWPLGIITSAIYIYVFRTERFYAGMALQGYYLMISIYGWWKWRYGAGKVQSETDGKHTMPVTRIKPTTAIICLLSVVILCLLLWYILERWTDSPVPFWDGLITSLSVVATWLLTRKVFEQWHIWIIANIIAVIVYLLNKMIPTSFLFFVYLIMAITGLREWKRNMHGKDLRNTDL